MASGLKVDTDSRCDVVPLTMGNGVSSPRQRWADQTCNLYWWVAPGIGTDRWEQKISRYLLFIGMRAAWVNRYLSQLPFSSGGIGMFCGVRLGLKSGGSQSSTPSALRETERYLSATIHLLKVLLEVIILAFALDHAPLLLPSFTRC
jgi:hypothetical protein